MVSAIEREKQMKKWNRAWKLELIETHNRTGEICGKGFFERMKPGFPLSRE
jgi:putative endonuclease